MIKTIATNVNDYTIWVYTQDTDLFNIFATDNINMTRYHLADFDGAKYNIKNDVKFNEIFVKHSKIRPTIIKNLGSIVKLSRKNNNLFPDSHTQLVCFKRRTNIYIKRKYRKVLRSILTWV
jgi:hypothetical protein